MSYGKHYNTKNTPQNQRDPAHPEQVENNAGGFTFTVDKWDRLMRFLILGSDKGSYYVGAAEMSRENSDHIVDLIKADAARVLATVIDVSTHGRAPKNDPAIWVLALVATFGDDDARRAAYAVMPDIARTGTHLFTFIEYREALGGWGTGMRKAVSRWYTQKSPDQLAYQLLKYKQRGGWSHRDVMRLAHPITDSGQHRAMFDVTTHPDKMVSMLGDLPNIYTGYARANMPDQNDGNRAGVIDQFGLSREMLPTDWLKDVEVWKAMLPKMPLTAMIRNLGVMTANETLKPLSDEVQEVTGKLRDSNYLKRSRVHPISVLMALRIYAQGHGMFGGKAWNTIPQIVDALDDAFYAAFDNVEPTGKRILMGIDVSGSMTWHGIGVLTAREIAAAMAMTFLKTEPQCYTFGFSNTFVDLALSPKMRLDDVITKTSNLPFSSTDCALPMYHALDHGIEADVFIVITDSETWAGHRGHPHQALAEYRQKTGIPAKLVVMGVTASSFTIADPNDAGMLDVAGFDASVPTVVSSFMKS